MATIRITVSQVSRGFRRAHGSTNDPAKRGKTPTRSGPGAFLLVRPPAKRMSCGLEHEAMKMAAVCATLPDKDAHREGHKQSRWRRCYERVLRPMVDRKTRSLPKPQEHLDETLELGAVRDICRLNILKSPHCTTTRHSSDGGCSIRRRHEKRLRDYQNAPPRPGDFGHEGRAALIFQAQTAVVTMRDKPLGGRLERLEPYKDDGMYNGARTTSRNSATTQACSDLRHFAWRALARNCGF
jgi:hypothetical protein